MTNILLACILAVLLFPYIVIVDDGGDDDGSFRDNQ